MNEEKLQRLEEKIREAVPESKKLAPIESSSLFTILLGYAKDLPQKEVNKVYGRPLNLQDCLIALDKNCNRNIWEDDITFEIFCYHKYDLTKDYHHQSTEFYEFLYSLLIDE